MLDAMLFRFSEDCPSLRKSEQACWCYKHNSFYASVEFATKWPLNAFLVPTWANFGSQNLSKWRLGVVLERSWGILVAPWGGPRGLLRFLGGFGTVRGVDPLPTGGPQEVGPPKRSWGIVFWPSVVAVGRACP